MGGSLSYVNLRAGSAAAWAAGSATHGGENVSATGRNPDLVTQRRAG